MNRHSNSSFLVEQQTAESDSLMADNLSNKTIKSANKEDTENPELDDLDSFNLIEPPPLDWKSDSSTEGDSLIDVDDRSFLTICDPQPYVAPQSCPQEQVSSLINHQDCHAGSIVEEIVDDRGKNENYQMNGDEQSEEYRPDDDDHTEIQELLSQLHVFKQTSLSNTSTQDLSGPITYTPSERIVASADFGILQPGNEGHQCGGLLFSESNHKDLLGLLECSEREIQAQGADGPNLLSYSGDIDAVVSVSYSQEEGERFWDHFTSNHAKINYESVSETPQCASLKAAGRTSSGEETDSECHPAYKDVPGPCDPEDLLDGVIFGAKYLGSTQLMSEKNPSTNARMAQAQEAVDRIKAPEGESQPMTEVDLFVSTQRIKVLSADTQEAMMDHPLQMISYIADIGSIVVLMARRKPVGKKGMDGSPQSDSPGPRKNCCMICHVFSSEDAQIIAQAIGQAFGVAYQQFLQANGIKASELRPSEYSDYLGTQELYNGDLVHFSRSENIREVTIIKAQGEILGLAIVESGWGSILPTVVVANLLHGGPAERSGELSIGDRIMSVNGTSLVGLPLTTCQSIIRDLKNQTVIKLSIVHCPPVTMAIIKRPDPKYQLGFSVEDGIICSLMRGGIAERGGIRVGHRIIEINGQSVVATPHEKIIHILTHAVGEIHLKTMPASTYRLLTGQEQPLFL
uniref:Amyloid-beta A4 precursor protein-binding family A member 3 n=1 Tax=Scleropages formosus TaxID=113540 RepID=A0A8C9VVE2_SCLFO